MSALPENPNWTVEEYLDFDQPSDIRHEYLHGMVYAMSGASERHNTLTVAIAALLYMQILDRPCWVFQSDTRVAVTESVYYYPDVVLLCHPPEYTSAAENNLTNPQVIFEVLSPSTEDYDRGRKFFYYRQNPALQAYVLVSQHQMRVEVYSRTAQNAWTFIEYQNPDDVIQVEDVTLTLSDIYRKVSFDD